MGAGALCCWRPTGRPSAPDDKIALPPLHGVGGRQGTSARFAREVPLIGNTQHSCDLGNTCLTRWEHPLWPPVSPAESLPPAARRPPCGCMTDGRAPFQSTCASLPVALPPLLQWHGAPLASRHPRSGSWCLHGSGRELTARSVRQAQGTLHLSPASLQPPQINGMYKCFH